MALQDVTALELRVKGIGDLFANPDLQIAFQECRAEVLDKFEDNFLTASSPNHGPWPARKNPKLTHPLLIKTGSLMKAATGKGPGHVTIWFEDGFQVGIDISTGRYMTFRDPRGFPGGVPAARAHNFGSGSLPQREFLAIDEATTQKIREILTRHVAEQLEKIANG